MTLSRSECTIWAPAENEEVAVNLSMTMSLVNTQRMISASCLYVQPAWQAGDIKLSHDPLAPLIHVLAVIDHTTQSVSLRSNMHTTVDMIEFDH